MLSASLRTWTGPRAAKLDEIEAAHAALSGSGRGRRWATEQVNHAYAVLLSSQFQAFCRDLHSECVGSFVRGISAQPMARVVRAQLVLSRRLDRGNPTPGNIGADFDRLGLKLWPAVRHLDSRNASRQLRLEQLSGWRNAIAHQDFGRAVLVPTRLHLPTVRAWRRACNSLARSFDRVMRSYLASITGSEPW
jgi:hypothetical protein